MLFSGGKIAPPGESLTGHLDTTVEDVIVTWVAWIHSHSTGRVTYRNMVASRMPKFAKNATGNGQILLMLKLLDDDACSARMTLHASSNACKTLSMARDSGRSVDLESPKPVQNARRSTVDGRRRDARTVIRSLASEILMLL